MSHVETSTTINRNAKMPRASSVTNGCSCIETRFTLLGDLLRSREGDDDVELGLAIYLWMRGRYRMCRRDKTGEGLREHDPRLSLQSRGQPSAHLLIAHSNYPRRQGHKHTRRSIVRVPSSRFKAISIDIIQGTTRRIISSQECHTISTRQTDPRSLVRSLSPGESKTLRRRTGSVKLKSICSTRRHGDRSGYYQGEPPNRCRQTTGKESSCKLTSYTLARLFQPRPRSQM